MPPPSTVSPIGNVTWAPSFRYSTYKPPHFVRGMADLTKLIVAVVMFFVVLIAVLGPALCIRKHRGRASSPNSWWKFQRTVISCLNCFAGGVFLSTGMLDVLPDAMSDIDLGLKAYHRTVDYPVALLCLLLGFFILLSLEQMVACCTFQHPHSHDPTERTPLFFDSTMEASESRDWRTVSLTASLEGIHPPTLSSSPEINAAVMDRRRSRRLGTYRRASCNAVVIPPRTTAMGDVSRFDRSSVVNTTTQSFNDTPSEGSEAAQHDHFVEMLTSGGSPIRSMFLIGALSVHSLFEGLALGLEEKNDSIYQLIFAICLHKCILSLAIGLSLGQTVNIGRKVLGVGSFIFAFASPLGTVVGMALRYEAAKSGKESLHRFKLVSGILQGMACGTFVYVTFFEILPREINEATRPRQRTLYMIFLLFGFVVMSILVNWA